MLFRTMILAALLSTLMGCGYTAGHLVTPIDSPRVSLPGGLLVPPIKPQPPSDGSREVILEHAIEYGEYVRQLELQNRGLIEFNEVLNGN